MYFTGQIIALDSTFVGILAFIARIIQSVRILKHEKSSMSRIYHNHTLQTNLQQREEEPQNTHSHNTAGRQLN